MRLSDSIPSKRNTKSIPSMNVRIADDVPDLGQVYYARNLPIVQQRLIAGGVRLATLLNNILTGV